MTIVVLYMVLILNLIVEKILVVPEALKGACGIAYTTTKDDNPTLYDTERDGNALGKWL